MKGAWRSDWQQAADEKAALEERLARIQSAFDYVLPFVHVDIRDKALQIASGEVNSTSSE